LQKDQKWQMWLQIGQTVGYPALGLIVILMLFRLFKRAPDVDIPIGVPVGDSQANGRGRSPAVTVDVLNQLIRENPQNMTQAIRGWMTRGESK
jgi:hypothetical protein